MKLRYNCCSFNIIEGRGKQLEPAVLANLAIKPKSFIMVHLKINPKKNSDPKRIGIIGTLGAEMTLDTAIMIFLLQECSEKVFNARKSKVQFFKQEDLDSSSFKHKIKKSDVLTVNVFTPDKTDKDFTGIKDVLKAIKKESNPIIAVLLADAKNQSASEEVQNIFGKTLGDDLTALKEKHEKNPEQFYLSVRRALLERKLNIKKYFEEFDFRAQIKNIAVKEGVVIFASSKILQNTNLIRLIGHGARKADIIFQRHSYENVISAGDKARKYMPAIIKKLNILEPATWLEKDGIIYSDRSSASNIPFGRMLNIIERAITEFNPVQTERMRMVNA